MLVSAIYQHESAIGIRVSLLNLPPTTHPTPPHRGVTEHLIGAPCVIWHLPTGWLFHTW